MLPAWGSLPFDDMQDVETAMLQYIAGPYVRIDGPGLYRETKHFASVGSLGEPINLTDDPVPLPYVGESFHTYLHRVTGTSYDNSPIIGDVQGLASDFSDWIITNVNSYLGTSINANVSAATSGADFTANWPVDPTAVSNAIAESEQITQNALDATLGITAQDQNALTVLADWTGPSADAQELAGALTQLKTYVVPVPAAPAPPTSALDRPLIGNVTVKQAGFGALALGLLAYLFM